MKLNILTLVAHGRDAFDMVGGALANHVERGDRGTVAVISSENYSDAMRLYGRIKSPHRVAQVFFICPPGNTTRLDWEVADQNCRTKRG